MPWVSRFPCPSGESSHQREKTPFPNSCRAVLYLGPDSVLPYAGVDPENTTGVTTIRPEQTRCAGLFPFPNYNTPKAPLA